MFQSYNMNPSYLFLNPNLDFLSEKELKEIAQQTIGIIEFLDQIHLKNIMT